MAPSNPVRAPVLYPGARRAEAGLPALAGLWEGRESLPLRPEYLSSDPTALPLSRASKQGSEGWAHQQPAQATHRDMPLNTQVNPRQCTGRPMEPLSAAWEQKPPTSVVSRFWPAFSPGTWPESGALVSAIGMDALVP